MEFPSSVGSDLHRTVSAVKHFLLPSNNSEPHSSVSNLGPPDPVQLVSRLYEEGGLEHLLVDKAKKAQILRLSDRKPFPHPRPPTVFVVGIAFARFILVFGPADC